MVRAETAMAGRECFCRGCDGGERHVWFLPRTGPRGVVVAAVFDQLPTGSYEVWAEGCVGSRTVEVHGGSIGELVWSFPLERERP